MARCCIALGGNSENSNAKFAQAIAMLGTRGLSVLRLSSTTKTPAMGKDAGSDFVNAAAVVESDLSPADLLRVLHQVEAELGRERTIHWGPRIIDLDLLFYADQVLDDDQVVLPHPSLWYRRFVLDPLSEIASNWIHPLLNETVERLRSRLGHTTIAIEIEECPLTQCGRLQELVRRLWDGYQLQIQVTSPAAFQSSDVFVRFIQTATSQRSQPVGETARIVRVPVGVDVDVDEWEYWQRLLTDFKTAAFG